MAARRTLWHDPTRMLSGDEAQGVDEEPVPATVVCARCGAGACGCAEETDAAAPATVGRVPWEGGGPWHARLFDTAEATTRGSEAFFGALTEGPVARALAFALACEAVAVGSTALALAPIAAFVAAFVPAGLVAAVAPTATKQLALAAAAALAVVAFAAILIIAHVLHGLGLALGVARSRRGATLGLRFGLYACGWDVFSSPAGVALALARRGAGATARLMGAAVSAPRRSTEAFLDGPLQVAPERARFVRARAIVVAMAFSVVAVFIVLVALIATPLLA